MNGPAHYGEAERLTDLVMKTPKPTKADEVNLAAAQVHATLALAAVYADTHRGVLAGTQPDWIELTR